MKLEENIYPYFPEGSKLPFCLTGIGGSEYQCPISRPNGYQWHQILYCAKGEGILKTDKGELPLKSGSCFFLPKDMPHEYYPVTEKWDVRWMSFDGTSCISVLKQLDMEGAIVVSLPERSGLEDIFDKMVTSQKEDILYCGYTCSGLVYDYIIEFHRAMNEDVGCARSRKLSMILPALIYISDHYSEDFSLTDLADVVGVTPQHLCRLFRDALNMRPTDYLLGRRLDEAKRLIRNSDMSLSEISQKCGFNDPSYFSTVFKKHEGCSPAVYRKNAK